MGVTITVSKDRNWKGIYRANPKRLETFNCLSLKGIQKVNSSKTSATDSLRKVNTELKSIKSQKKGLSRKEKAKLDQKFKLMRKIYD